MLTNGGDHKHGFSRPSRPPSLNFGLYWTGHIQTWMHFPTLDLEPSVTSSHGLKDLLGGFEQFLNLQPSVHLRPMQRAGSLPLAHLEEK